MEILYSILIFVFFILLGLLFQAFWNSVRHRRLIQDLPTAKSTGVFIGLVELKGTAESEAPLQTFLSERPAVWYSWTISEEWRRTRTEFTTDSKGRTQTRTVTDTGWETIGSGSESSLFYLKDDYGVLRIDPDKAKIEGKLTLFETCDQTDPFYDRFGSFHSVIGSTGRRQFTETAIPLHEKIYVIGRSRVRNDAVAAEIAWEKETPFFLISTKTEEQVARSRSISAWLSALGFILLAGIFPGLVFQDVQPGLIGAGVGGGIIAITWIWLVHRSFVELRNRANQALSNLDVELKRRFDLIPRLVEVVTGMKEYERALLTELARLRTESTLWRGQGGGEEKEKTGLKPLTPVILGMMEKYPSLGANPVFLNLQRNLTETEDRIALARSYYNDLVEYIQTRRSTFPDGIIAFFSGLRKIDYFHAEAFETRPIDVDLR